MPDQAGKLSSERNGGYTRLMGPFHPAEGHGGQLSSLRSAGNNIICKKKYLSQNVIKTECAQQYTIHQVSNSFTQNEGKGEF
jgi:hypothetical protein